MLWINESILRTCFGPEKNSMLLSHLDFFFFNVVVLHSFEEKNCCFAKAYKALSVSVMDEYRFFFECIFLTY